MCACAYAQTNEIYKNNRSAFVSMSCSKRSCSKWMILTPLSILFVYVRHSKQANTLCWHLRSIVIALRFYQQLITSTFLRFVLHHPPLTRNWLLQNTSLINYYADFTSAKTRTTISLGIKHTNTFALALDSPETKDGISVQYRRERDGRMVAAI